MAGRVLVRSRRRPPRGQDAAAEDERPDDVESKFPFRIASPHCDNGGGDPEPPSRGTPGEPTGKPVPVVLKVPPLQRQRARRGEEPPLRAAALRRGQARPPLAAGRTREVLRRLDGLSELLLPCKMLVAQEKRPGGKGFRCRHDRPKTPFQRLLDEGVLSPERRRRLEAYRADLGGMELHRRVLKRLRKIRRMQERYNMARRMGEGGPAPGGGTRQNHVNERSLSVQYLANQKPSDYLWSVLPI